MNNEHYWVLTNVPGCRLKASCLGHLGQFCNPFKQSSLCPYSHSTSADILIANLCSSSTITTDSQRVIIPLKAAEPGRMEPKLRPHAIANFIQTTCTLRVKESHLFMSKVLVGSSCTQSQGQIPHDKNMFSHNSQIWSKFLPTCCTWEGGAQTHIPRAILCSEETEVTEHI